MSKLRINNVEDDTSPREIRKMLKRFGNVGEISIHTNGNLIYALVDKMADDDAKAVMDAINEEEWEKTDGLGSGRNSQPKWTASNEVGYRTIGVPCKSRRGMVNSGQRLPRILPVRPDAVRRLVTARTLMAQRSQGAETIRITTKQRML